jgi:hypothetical protein
LITDTKVFKEEDMLLSEITVLKITDDHFVMLNRKAAEFVSEGVFAMIDPIQNLPLGILRFSKDGFPVDPQGGI